MSVIFVILIDNIFVNAIDYKRFFMNADFFIISLLMLTELFMIIQNYFKAVWNLLNEIGPHSIHAFSDLRIANCLLFEFNLYRISCFIISHTLKLFFFFFLFSLAGTIIFSYALNLFKKNLFLLICVTFENTKRKLSSVTPD